MKTFNKISNIKEYNQYVEKNYPNQIQLFFQKNYGYILYGYNCLNVKNDFIDYEPLPQKMVDDSNEELDKALQFKINKRGF